MLKRWFQKRLVTLERRIKSKELKNKEEGDARGTKSVSVGVAKTGSCPTASSSTCFRVTRMTNIYRNPPSVFTRACTVASWFNFQRPTQWTGDTFACMTTSIACEKVIKINKKSHMYLTRDKQTESELNHLSRGLKPHLPPPLPSPCHWTTPTVPLPFSPAPPSKKNKLLFFFFLTQTSWHVKHETPEDLRYLAGLTFNPIP